MTEIQVEHLESHTSHEYELSLYFAMLLTLLMIAIIVSNYTSHKLHLHWLPEAAGKKLSSFVRSRRRKAF